MSFILMILLFLYGASILVLHLLAGTVQARISIEGFGRKIEFHLSKTFIMLMPGINTFYAVKVLVAFNDGEDDCDL